MNLIIVTIVSLGAIGAVSAVILYFVAQKFKVAEDPVSTKLKEYFREPIVADAAVPVVATLQNVVLRQVP